MLIMMVKMRMVTPILGTSENENPSIKSGNNNANARTFADEPLLSQWERERTK